MIDPGHPFSVTLPDLVAALEDRVRNGVEQPASTRFLVSETATSFELPSGTYAVPRVAGLLHAEYTVFTANEHYEVRGNRLVWVSTTDRPDASSWLDVDYTYRDRPAGLTDFNAGSVVSTLLRAVAYEIKTLYAQMDEAYRRAFIDQATGVALDSVVALLGVPRKPAQAAKGTVTFRRKRATDLPVPIPLQTRVADRAGRVFVTSEATGIESSLEEFRLPQSGVVTVTNWIAEVVGVWPRSVDPNTAPSLGATLDHDDPRVLHVDPSTTAELRIRYRPRSATVPIDAQAPGPEGNAAPDMIVVMPTPPTGIDGITNESALTGGTEAEPDDQLRERAKHALERAGNATLDAIRFALLGIEGVSGVTVTDHATDETIPLGEVWVRWAGDPAVALLVDQVIASTRAAGVVARIQRINEVRLSGTMYAIPEPGAQQSATAVLLEHVTATLDGLPIAEPLSLRRLTALAYDVPGLADVAESVLTYTRPRPGQDPPEQTGAVTDPFIVGPTEVVRAATGKLSVVLLAGPAVTAAEGTGSTHNLTITLLDRANQLAPLTSFALDLAVTVKARSRETPDRPAVPVGRTVKKTTFGSDHTAKVVLEPADYQAYDRAEHLPDLTVAVAAAVYPGLTTAAVTITLPDGG